MTPLQHCIWRIGWILAGLAAVAIIWLIPAGSATCIRLAADVEKAGNCLEFWLNRYQGVLGNLLTATIATVALLWAALQWLAAHRQSAVAVRDMLERKLANYAAEATATRKLSRTIEDLTLRASGTDLSSPRSQALLQESTALGQTYAEMEGPITTITQFRSSEPRNVGRSERRARLIKIAEEVEWELTRIGMSIYRCFQTGSPPPIEITAAADALLETARQHRKEFRRHEDDLLAAQEAIWRRIEALENSAMQGD